MKILLMTNFYPPPLAGSERHIMELSKNLANRNYEVYILYVPIAGHMIFPNKNRKIDILQSPPENVKLVVANKKTYFLDMLSTIKKIDPDVIHAHNFKIGGYASIIGWILKKPVVCSVLLAEKKRKDFQRKVSVALLRRFLNKIVYIFISKEIQEITLEDISPEKYYMIPVWAWNYEPLQTTDGKIFRDMFPKDAKISLTVSRIEEEKGIDYLIEAGKKVIEKHPNCYFVIVGSGSKLEYYKNLKLKNIRFLGRMSDEELLQAYKGCDFITIPSPMDFLFVLMESLATGKPIVSSAVKSAKEVLTDGKDALLFEPRDSKKMAKQIIRILEDKKLYKKISENVKEVAKRYDTQKCITEIENVYNEVLASFPH